MLQQIDFSYFRYILRNMKVGERGQITIPLKLRKRFGIRAHTEVELLEENHQIVLRKKATQGTLSKFSGILKGKGLRSDTLIEEMRGR